jgi:predicted adenylyl cyclase CyaB
MVMKRELKLKARILSPENLRLQLKKIAKNICTESCRDYFFKNELIQKGKDFRLRKYNEGKLIIFKMQESEDLIQENFEFKFNVEDAGDFLKFLDVAGFKPTSSIKKVSEVFQKERIGIRLSEVESLGYFIEITIEVLDDSFEDCKEKMLAILDELKIDRSVIEKRYYSSIKEENDSSLSGDKDLSV